MLGWTWPCYSRRGKLVYASIVRHANDGSRAQVQSPEILKRNQERQTCSRAASPHVTQSLSDRNDQHPIEGNFSNRQYSEFKPVLRPICFCLFVLWLARLSVHSISDSAGLTKICQYLLLFGLFCLFFFFWFFFKVSERKMGFGNLSRLSGSLSTGSAVRIDNGSPLVSFFFLSLSHSFHLPFSMLLVI